MAHHHPYFGQIDLAPPDWVRWESAPIVNGKAVETLLWIESAQQWDIGALDHFAHRAQQLDTLDQQARSRLIDYLTLDDQYMGFHLDELSDGPGVAALVAAHGKQPTPAQFAQAMCLHNIGFWLSSDGHQVVADYKIDPELSDEILAVKFKPDGDFIAVDWES